MLGVSVSLRCGGWALGSLALMASLFGGSVPVTAQTDSHPTFEAAPLVALTFLVGSAQTTRLSTATGGDGALTYTIDPATPLPAGLAFDAATHTVGGTAQTSQAAATYRLIATDADGDTATLSFTLAVNAQPSFAATEPALTFMAGTAQTSEALPMATGGDGPLTYAIDPATPLPTGLTFNATDRAVAASATAALQLAATYRLVATDADGDTATQPFTIAIVKDYDANDNRLIEITTLAQLDAVRYDLNGMGWSSVAAYAAAFPHAARGMGCSNFCHGYELTTDLDFDQNGDGRITAADAAYWNNGAGWNPIGPDSGDQPFSGIFQGNGHVISHLFIHRSEDAYVGLFARVSQRFRTEGRGRVDALMLQDVQIRGDRYVGGIAGFNNGEIAASFVSGTVAGSNNRVGGLAGHNSGAITASTASASIVGTQSVGGLAGSNGGAIVVSYATGSVTGRGNEVGGLAGDNTGQIIGSFARGAVMGRSDANVGGFVGRNDGAVTASYATGAVTASGSQVGGLAGTNAAAGRIAASYATGTVTASGSQDVGGLVGNNQGAVAASYAAGGVAGGTRVGGLIGNNQGPGTVTASYARGAVSGRTQVGGLAGAATALSAITASYWDTTASGQAASSGGTGQTTQALQAPTAYAGLYAAWNVNADGRAGTDAPWDFGTASQYPALQYDCLCSADQQRTD